MYFYELEKNRQNKNSSLIDWMHGGGGLRWIHSPPTQSLNQIQNKKESYMNHIIQESILEYKLTYSGERLFGASIPRAFIKSIKESVKCFIDLIKPHSYEDMF